LVYAKRFFLSAANGHYFTTFINLKLRNSGSFLVSTFPPSTANSNALSISCCDATDFIPLAKPRASLISTTTRQEAGNTANAATDQRMRLSLKAI
jgi:hypothetical protein